MKNKKIYITSFVILLLMILLMNSAYAFSGEVTSVYGWRIHPIFGIGKGHEGVDIAVPTGVGVPSLATGTVVTVVGVVDMDILYLFRMPMVYAGIWGIILNYFIQLVHTLYKGR